MNPQHWALVNHEWSIISHRAVAEEAPKRLPAGPERLILLPVDRPALNHFREHDPHADCRVNGASLDRTSGAKRDSVARI